MRKPRHHLSIEQLAKLSEIETYIKSNRLPQHIVSVQLGLSKSALGRWFFFKQGPTLKNYIKLEEWYKSFRKDPQPLSQPRRTRTVRAKTRRRSVYEY